VSAIRFVDAVEGCDAVGRLRHGWGLVLVTLEIVIANERVTRK
jgi:hypothetical protein